MASYPLGKQTDEHEEEASLDGGTFHQPNIQSTAAVYPPVVPGCSRSSATSRSRDIARGIPKEPTTHTSDTYAPYVETALGQAKTEPSVGQVVGPQLTAEADFFDLKRPYKTPIPGVKNAYTSNYLPTPALGVYKQNPPPIKSIGKFIHHPKYKTGNERYLGFLKNNWPLESPSAYDLATAGMVYIGPVYDRDGTTIISDQVFCYKCGKTFRDWKEGDDPKEQHLKLFPQCFQETWTEV